MASRTIGWGSSMSAETTPALRFPTPCSTCGGVLYQYVNFCPYCGVSRPLEAGRPKRAQTQLRAVPAETRRAPAIVDDPTECAAPNVIWQGAGEPEFSPDVVRLSLPQAVGRWIVTRGAIPLAGLALLGVVGYLWLGHGHTRDTDNGELSTGVDASSRSIPQYMPPSKDGVSSMDVTGQPGVNKIAQPVASRAPGGAQSHRTVSDALGDARAALARNDLTQAKAAVANALLLAPGNPDALRMQTEVKDRENQRDVAIGVANSCANDKIWSCVFKLSNQALAIDVGSVEAQALLQRAILSTGWKPLGEKAAPAPRKPPPVVANSAPTRLPTGLPTLPPLPPGTPTDSARPSANNAAPAAWVAAGSRWRDAQTSAMRGADGGSLSPVVSVTTK
ncbi:hypothetical protein BZM27_05175 [Paraburkholderia steynii]|uniref:Zinc ribbon domain-containing protein n=1 Tax=Paraburkholderia steynii TaxID=1245441 RepID=A0A4R0XG32_9BURK|nr:hypothetical protein BZM27_05175 [Paraburkholderia steynii]